MIENDVGKRWIIVHKDLNDPVVRRYPVHGGWLYQVSVERAGDSEGKYHIDQLTWHPPQFVPRLIGPTSGSNLPE